jgi:hypothetical protein
MATLQTPQSIRRQPTDFDEKDAILLEQIAERLVRYGQQVGVTPEEMISLLDCGISIKDLLAFSPRSHLEPRRIVAALTVFRRHCTTFGQLTLGGNWR